MYREIFSEGLDKQPYQLYNTAVRITQVIQFVIVKG